MFDCKKEGERSKNFLSEPDSSKTFWQLGCQVAALFPPLVGGWVGVWLGGWVAGLNGNIAISAQLELELGLSLAKLIRVTAKNEALEISFQMKLKTNISKSN